MTCSINIRCCWPHRCPASTLLSTLASLSSSLNISFYIPVLIQLICKDILYAARWFVNQFQWQLPQTACTWPKSSFTQTSEMSHGPCTGSCLLNGWWRQTPKVVSMSAPAGLSVCLVPSLSLSLSYAAATGQEAKWVTGLCLIDPPSATGVIFLSSGPVAGG